jgi:hypothetical protein
MTMLIHDGAVAPDSVGGGLSTPAIVCGSTISASATLVTSFPSCVRTRTVSSHAFDTDNLLIALPNLSAALCEARPARATALAVAPGEDHFGTRTWR